MFRTLASVLVSGAVITGLHMTAATSPSEAAVPNEVSQQPPSPTPGQIAREIDRVVDEVRANSAARTMARSTKDKLRDRVNDTFRCVEFLSGVRYCLNYGWTTTTEREVRADMLSSARQESALKAPVASTGDLSILAMLDQTSEMSTHERVTSVRSDLKEAAEGIDSFLKTEELRTLLTPTSVKSRAASSAGIAATPRKQPVQESGKILKDRVVEQEHAYWCGPATIQMMAWNWGKHKKVSQPTWAKRLGTTKSGTSIHAMVKLINKDPQLSKWVKKQGKKYEARNIEKHTFPQWYALNVNHYDKYGTPVILHPLLLKKYFPYLDKDSGGHFQLGRGWDFDSHTAKSEKLLYYEPFNPRRFNPERRFVARKQKRIATSSFKANKAHFQHNIGV